MNTTTMNTTTMNTTTNDWQEAKRRPRRPRHDARAQSPTPSTASTSTTSSTFTLRSRAPSSASAASTRPRDRPRSTSCRHDITTLVVGNSVSGVVTGARDFGAFIDVGVGKDGLLHASEADASGMHVADVRQKLNVGQRVSLYVKTVDAVNGKFTLTARKTASRPGPSAAAVAASAAAAEREYRAKERQRLAREAMEQDRLRQQAEARVRAEEEARLAKLEAAMIEDAAQREAEAKAAREAAGLLLPAAELLKCDGQRLPPPPPARPVEVLVTKVLPGNRTLVLRKMPWKYACGSSAVAVQ